MYYKIIKIGTSNLRVEYEAEEINDEISTDKGTIKVKEKNITITNILLIDIILITGELNLIPVYDLFNELKIVSIIKEKICATL